MITTANVFVRQCCCLALLTFTWIEVNDASPQDDLFTAVRTNNDKMITAALDAGADINYQGAQKRTPLMSAVLEGKTQAARILIISGADITIPEKDGYTPIHGAGFQGRAAIAKMLVKRGGARVDDRHEDGYTPLHRACWGREQRHADTVRTMLELGGSLADKTADGKTLKEICTNEASLKVIEEFEASSAAAGGEGQGSTSDEL
eukprot:m.80534 g.80534  ORF g.80534 m.80534 type:complete len:205 (+) comp16297_c0_seq1:66-680(+)